MSSQPIGSTSGDSQNGLKSGGTHTDDFFEGPPDAMPGRVVIQDLTRVFGEKIAVNRCCYT